MYPIVTEVWLWGSDMDDKDACCRTLYLRLFKTHPLPDVKQQLGITRNNHLGSLTLE